MNIMRSELMEHTKLLKYFANLPLDLRKYIQNFYKSTLPTITCPYCNWESVNNNWSIYEPHHFCCSWGRLHLP